MNTPKTDAACGWPWGHHGRIESSDLKWSPDGPFVHASVARELERENAALRAHAERVSEANDRLVVENDRLQMELDASCNAEELRHVRAENAALREDKERLDWLLTHEGGSWLYWAIENGQWTPEVGASRAAIDAARKEAQP